MFVRSVLAPLPLSSVRTAGRFLCEKRGELRVERARHGSCVLYLASQKAEAVSSSSDAAWLGSGFAK